jgi:hypothetical protein
MRTNLACYDAASTNVSSASTVTNVGAPAQRHEERVDDGRGELRPAPGADLAGRLLDGACAGIRALGRHRVPGVGKPDDARLQRNPRTAP